MVSIAIPAKATIPFPVMFLKLAMVNLSFFEKLKVPFDFKDSHRKIFVAVFFSLNFTKKNSRNLSRSKKF